MVATFLVRAAGDPAQLAATLRTQLADPMLKIESLNEVTAQLTSTLTTLSLDALTRIEWGYTVLIAVVALIIFLLSLLAERRTEYATLAALGATPGQRNSFLYLEAGISGVAGLAIGAIVGTTLTQVLVTILTAIFDPPPIHTVLPGNAVALLLTLVATGLILSTGGVTLLLRRLAPAQILRNG
ncbi:MAG: FtsX-like permease family protein [Caldilineaceae bacterium]